MADIAAEFEEGGLKRTLKDLFAGAAGGIAQVLLGELFISSFVEPSELVTCARPHLTPLLTSGWDRPSHLTLMENDSPVSIFAIEFQISQLGFRSSS